jgi:glycosyltransferase involved in cell wall biosynthesis
MTQNPTFSIIMPVYNAERFLSEALDSAFAQTFTDFEVVVVDDGSTDNTAQILASYGERIRVLTQENGGPSKARNAAIRASRGEFIAFLDSDDIWDARKLELQIAVMREDENIGFCFSDCQYFDSENIWEGNMGSRVPPMEQMFDAMLTEHFITLSSVVVRRKCVDAVGPFDESLIGCEDYNFYLRVADRYGFHFMPQSLVKSRCHADNLSNDLAQMRQDEIANLDKIAAMFPEREIDKRRLSAKILFRFGQYHFDRQEFPLARSCFARAIAGAPFRPSTYVYLAASALPAGVRQKLRGALRAVRGSQTGNEQIASAPSTAPPQKRAVMMITWSFVAGGSETYALTLAKNLDRDRFSPLMCALDQGGALESEIRRLQIPLRVMHRRAGLQFGLMGRMFRLFRRKRVRVVHTHHFNQLFYSVLGAKLCGARLIHTEHSVEHLKKKHLRVATRILSLACYRVIAIGDDGARVLREDVGIAPEKLQIIRAGIDLDAFNESREEARREFGIEQNAPVAAIVARLSSEKNHRNLLDAWADVVRNVPNATLLVAGEGGEGAALRAQIEQLGLENRVKMLGVRRDVARVLAACDVFVLSSDREGLPVSVLEAMAASRAVVATHVGDLPRVVREGETGLLVPPCDAAALAAALVSLLSDSARATQFGKAGKRAVAGYGLGPMIEAHQELYSA